MQPKKYVHMGHDEVYQIGVCPLCKGKDPAQLFADDVRKYRDHLADRGLTMMIWSDMLQPVGENGKNMKTRDAVSRIPKDVVLLDFIWYFHPGKDIEDNLLPYGFRTIFGNLYSSHFPRFSSRIRKDGILGGQISAWVETREDPLAKEGKLYDFLYTAQMLWSEHYSSHNRYAYDRLIRRKLPSLRRQLQSIPHPALHSGIHTQVILDAGGFDPDTAVEGGVFAVDCKADTLVFAHTASHPYRRLLWTQLDVIADYQITYEDGSQILIPITYAGNIFHWNRRQSEPFDNMFYRHNGYSAVWYADGEEFRLPDGRIACIYHWEWINPHPQRTIREIAVIRKIDAETQVIVQKITAVRL